MNNQRFPLTSPSPTPSLSLPEVGELLRESFQIFKNRIWVFLLLMLIILLVPFLFILPFAIFFFSLGLVQDRIPDFLFIPLTVFGILMAVIAFLVMVVINLWAGLSLLYAIKERDQKIGIKESLAKGWPKIISYLWISILAGFITIGGYLLLIVPGIILAIWFSLAAFVLVSEGLKGMNALFRSKQLIKGFWWQVFWRFLVLNIIIFLIGLIVGFIPFVGRFIILFTVPFSMIFGFLIYENLKKLKGEALFESPRTKTKIAFILIGVIGFLLIPATILTLIALFS